MSSTVFGCSNLLSCEIIQHYRHTFCLYSAMASEIHISKFTVGGNCCRVYSMMVEIESSLMAGFKRLLHVLFLLLTGGDITVIHGH